MHLWKQLLPSNLGNSAKAFAWSAFLLVQAKSDPCLRQALHNTIDDLRVITHSSKNTNTGDALAKLDQYTSPSSKVILIYSCSDNKLAAVLTCLRSSSKNGAAMASPP